MQDAESDLNFPGRAWRGWHDSQNSGPRPSSAQLMQWLEAGGDAQMEAIVAVRGFVSRLAFESIGCRVIQLAMELAEPSVAIELVSEMRGHVRDAIASPHGNYVIQKIIEAMPVGEFSFIAEELQGVGASVARHRYGCRIFCRLLENSADDSGDQDTD